MADELFKFLFEGTQSTRSSVRGEIVSLRETWQAIRARHDYPPAVLRILGELVAASTLLSANLKFNGALVMQIHGDGPVKLLVVECNTDLTVRATAKLSPQAEIPADAGFQALVNVHGKGRFALTLDPKDRSRGQQPYQGIVPLEGDSIAQALESYMLRSEQLDTHLWLAADEDRANGVLLQKLPVTGGESMSEAVSASLGTELETALETWNRAVTFANTLERAELLSVDPQTLMRRLFWDETLRVFEPLPCAFHCSCSRERVAAMLVTLGQREVDDTLAEQGIVEVNCEFCNRQYAFDAVDCRQLFATSNTADGVRAAATQRH
ncbi:MAG: Hsp33 family molecular chaperone HslO [Burkholderiaceae bacterium]|jgi:molecular chaperone Hsp33